MTPTTPQGLVLHGGGVVGQHQGAPGPARAEQPGRVAGRPVEVVGDHHDLDEGVGVRLAVLTVDQGDQLVGAPDQQRLVGQQGPAAAVEAKRGPAPLPLPGPGHGGRDLLGPVDRERAHHLAGRRAGGVEGADVGRAVLGDRHALPFPRKECSHSAGRRQEIVAKRSWHWSLALLLRSIRPASRSALARGPEGSGNPRKGCPVGQDSPDRRSSPAPSPQDAIRARREH
jgi:hypothetical protein